MQISLINGTAMRYNTLAYRVARVIYAETLAASLRVVEALASMIQNVAKKNNLDIADIISDENIFESLNKKSPRHEYIYTDLTRNDFQMCLRVAIRMLHGKLPDMCNHATRFHRADVMPGWAFARGYVADIDGILFYA